MHVDLLCSDSWASNMGDVATALATANGLAERGIAVRRVPGDVGHPVVIGGGHLFRGRGAPNGATYSGARSPCFINAAGADVDAPVEWPLDVRFAVFRDHESATAFGPGAGVAPCPSILLDPLPFTMACEVPRWGNASRLPAGEFVIVHARPELYGFANASRDPVVAIEPAPYTWHPWEASGWLLPWTHAPELVASIIARSKAVVTLSLHLGVLAMAVGTPFAVLDRGTPQSEKCRRYWSRAGVPEVMYQGRHPVQHALDIAEKLRAVAVDERTSAREHLDRLAFAITEL